MPRRHPLCRFLLLGCVFSYAFAVANEREARAEEPALEYADGPSACHAFEERNERELRDWSRAQPATPYVYPRDKTILGAPWGPLTTGLSATSDLLLASVLPHVGAQMRLGSPAQVISWPWQIPFGPAFTCSRRPGTFTVRHSRANRFLFEPGILASARGAGVFVRPGYRFLYQPSDWVVGIGLGIGSTIELAGNREPPMRPSVSPEALVRFGHCCEASYFTLAMRYDRFFEGEATNVLWGSLGYTYF